MGWRTTTPPRTPSPPAPPRTSSRSTPGSSAPPSPPAPSPSSLPASTRASVSSSSSNSPLGFFSSPDPTRSMDALSSREPEIPPGHLYQRGRVRREGPRQRGRQVLPEGQGREDQEGRRHLRQQEGSLHRF